MNAVAYLRVSSGAQVESGLGLEAQEAAIRTCANRLGLNVAGIYRDEGVSGATTIDARPGLMDALTAVKKGDVLIVAKRDRIARDVLNAALIARLIERKGARLISAAGEGTDDDTPTSVLMRQIIDAFAQYERALISARTRAALQAKRARGERTGTIRYGLRQGVGTTLEPDPIEQRVLQLVRAQRQQGQGRATVARVLNEAGYTTRAGSAWTPNYIASLEKTQATA